MDTLVLTEMTIVVILLVVSLVAILVRRIRVPYTVALVLAGLALTLQHQWRLTMTPDLVLALFLPPLVFEASFHLQFKDLRENAVSILTLAVVGVALSAAIVAFILVGAGVLPVPVAILFGALISATDPVSVTATFKALGAPRSLGALLEGESLFNDGTAIVLFQIALLLVLHGTLDPVTGLVDFLRIAGGGVLLGLVLGYVVSLLLGRIDDYLIETTLTTVLAYGAYLLAEHVHVSGVLAVVMAGLINGNIGPRTMSPTSRIVIFNFWEYVAFLANSFVFLLIGMNVQIEELWHNLNAIIISIFAVLVARAVAVYGLSALLRPLRRSPPTSYQHVLFWGGLRGAVSLALALSLVEHGIPFERQLLAMAFGVVLFTLLIQGTTIPLILRGLGLVRRSKLSLQYERLQGRLLAIRSARRHLERLYNEGALIPQAWRTISQELDERETAVIEAIERLLVEHPELREHVVHLARIEALRAQRAALLTFLQEGLLSEDVAHQLIAEVDAQLEMLQNGPSQEDEEKEDQESAEDPPIRVIEEPVERSPEEPGEFGTSPGE
ncbi:MAG: Na+/H+ antiporter [Chloroflexi bacterium]|nr:Na+/H+ antiporter [Chloroflexota bacterium]